MLWLVILSVVGAVLGSEPAHLKPGALVGQMGRVALVEDAIWVKYPYATLASIPSRLEDVVSELDTCLARMDLEYRQNRTLMDDPTVLTILEKRISYVNETVTAALEAYLGVEGPKRVKRGYLDGFGELSRTLFGTAMNKEVVALRERYNHLVSIATANNRAIHINCKKLDRLDQHVKELGLYVNYLGSSMNRILTTMNSMYDFMLLSQALPALENTVNSVLHVNQIIVQNVVDAALGRVTPALLPVQDFRQALELGERVYGLLPLFDIRGIHHYYPLLESFVTNDAIVIHVPFQSRDEFEVHQLEPFPFEVNGTLMSLNLPPSIVLISLDYSLYATGTVGDLQHCQSEYLHYYHCPASQFAFLPITGGVCEVVLTQKNASKALSLCPYMELTPKFIFHKTFFSHHYFFFTRPFYVSIVCPEGTTYREVTGHFAVYLACHVRSANLTTFPSKLHQGFTKNSTARIYPLTGLAHINISNIKFVTNRVTELTFSNFSEIETVVQDSLPEYLTPYVHFPSLILPAVIILLLLVPMCLWLRRALTLYRYLRQKRQEAKTSNTTDTTPV